MEGDVLVDTYDAFRAWFWNKTFWLPENRTWADLKRDDTPGSPFYPDLYDLYVVFPIALALFLARLVWERYSNSTTLIWHRQHRRGRQGVGDIRPRISGKYFWANIM